MSPFWIVVGENNGPSRWPFRHPTQDAAIAESVRLARTIGGNFFVMEAQVFTRKNDVTVTRIADDSNIPF